MYNKGEKRNQSNNNFLQNWLKKQKQITDHNASEASNENYLECQQVNDDQGIISAATSINLNVEAASPLAESEGLFL